MSEILIQSKVTAPRLNSKIVHRGRLTSLLHENIDRSFIIVCAPAGFGKTTLVLDYLNNYSYKHAWFSLPHKGIEDASSFFEYLITSVNNINAEFGKETIDVLKQFTTNPKMSKDLVYACTASFVNEFQKCFEEDVILVIDDLHYIESQSSKAGLKEFFSELQDNIPANLHLVIVSRVMPDINLTTLKAKRNVFVIDEKVLSFSMEETEMLLKKVYRINYDDKDIKALDENIKGWITGLHLLLQAYGEDFTKIKYKGKISYKNIYEFFAQEIFDNLDSELQEFLMVTSLMESFDEVLVDNVLGITNSKDLTNELLHKNLFIQQISRSREERKTISYGYHALFREFLSRKLKQSRIEQEIRILMEKIGDSYVESGDKISAINYFIEVKNYDKAIPLILGVFHKLYDAGRYENIWQWFNLIPEEIADKNADLLHDIGYLYLYSKADYNRSLHYINKAYDIYEQNNNENGIVACLYVKSHILMETGKVSEVTSEIDKLLKNNLKQDNEIRIKEILFNVYLDTEKFKEALELMKDLYALSLKNENLIWKSRIIFKLAGAYYNTGDYEKAIKYYIESLKYEDTQYNIIMTYCNIALVYNDMNDYNNSLVYFNKVFKSLETSSPTELLIHVLGQKALLLQRIGDLEESNNLLLKAISLAEKNKALGHLWYLTDYISMNYILLNDFSNAKKYIDLNKLYISNSDFQKYMNIIREAELLVTHDINNVSTESIQDSYNYFESNNLEHKYIASRILANYYLLKNEKETAIEFLKQGTMESGFDANDLLFNRGLIDFALSRSELSYCKDKVHIAFKEFFDRLNIEGTSEEYKHKINNQIEDLYDLKMNAFGTLEFITRGEVIPESKWRRKKSKSILAYMMLDPKQKYSREHLTDLFFSDTKAKNINDTFRHDLSAINNAVKLPYLNIMQHEGKMLFLNPDCYLKSDIAEFNKYYKKIYSNNINNEDKINACKKAIELYKGDFIKNNYEKWCEDLRDQYNNKYISISELLLDLLYETKDIENLIHYSEKLLKYDKLNEHAYLKLVEAHMESGKIRAAKETYSKMLKIFEEELAEMPDKKILSRLNELIS